MNNTNFRYTREPPGRGGKRAKRDKSRGDNKSRALRRGHQGNKEEKKKKEKRQYEKGCEKYTKHQRKALSKEGKGEKSEDQRAQDLARLKALTKMRT